LAKFLFNLETLLKHRENVEQRERDELLRISYKYQIELRNRDDLMARRQEMMQELAQKQMENASDQELVWFHRYIERLGQEISECKKRLVQLESEVQAQKEVVIDASKKRKVLALLKAKKQKEYFMEMEKQEQKEIDDWIVTRFATTEVQTIEQHISADTKITE
jgi:flagellar protein FliJ